MSYGAVHGFNLRCITLFVHATEREALDEHQPTSRVRGIDNTALHTNVERVLAQYKLLPTM